MSPTDSTELTRPGYVARGWRAGAPTLRYWMQTEVHVYAFSIAANILLSFYPMLLVMTSICGRLLQWKAAVDAIYVALNNYIPPEITSQLERTLNPTIYAHNGRPYRTFHYVSVLLLLFTANGIFEPMEVALNRVWGCQTNRSFFRNQLLSYGLIFVCGVLMLLSTTLTALNANFWGAGLIFKAAAIPVSILILFLIYWILPNCKVRAAEALPVAIVVGILLELLKYVNLLTWPWLSRRLNREYGWLFEYGAAMVLWGFVAAMVILGGAEWAARRRTRPLL